MAIEFFDGFEFGKKPEWGAFSGGVYIAADSPRFGTYSLMSSQNSIIFLNLPPSPKKTIGFAMRMNSANVLTRADNQLMGAYSGGIGHFCMRFDTSGHIEVRRGEYNGTVLATSTQVWNTWGTYRYIEMQGTIDDAAGRVVVKVDGVTWIDFTGDTRNGGSNTNIDQFGFMWTGSADGRIDDMYVTNGTDDTATTGRPDNSFLGDVKVEVLIPNADGTTNQWVGSDGNSAANWDLVNEVPVNTSDYTGSSTVGQRDMWGMTNVGAQTSTVFAVQPAVYAAKDDAGAATIKIIHTDGSGTVVSSTDKALSTGYDYYWDDLRKVRPGGGAWTATEANVLQVGVEKS